jgi:hypothetical protein
LPGDCRATAAPYRLTEEIVALSVADTWREARREWSLSHVFFADADSPGTCLCGHPIIEHCVLHNHQNGKEAVVGNVCVTQFMGIRTDRLFGAFRRVMENAEAALTAEAVAYAYGRGWLTDWERAFCRDTCRRRRLSPRQMTKRVEINRLMLSRVTGVRRA